MENDKIEKSDFNMQEANFFSRNVSGIIDALFTLIVFLALIKFLPENIVTHMRSPIRPEIFVLILLILYRFISLVLFKETIGMRIAGIKILNHNFEPLSAKEKTFAALFILFKGVDYYDK